MKKLLIAFVVLLVVGCKKNECIAPQKTIANTEWIATHDTSMRISFSSNIISISHPVLTPNPECTFYHISNDTIFVPSVHVYYKFYFTKDTLVLTPKLKLINVY